MASVPNQQPISSTPSLNSQQPVLSAQAFQVPQPFLVQMPPSPEKKKTWLEHFQAFLQVLGAIVVPLTLLWGIYQFRVQQQDDQVNTIQQALIDDHRALDQQQQTTLDTYLDRMSDLLFSQHLSTASPSNEVVQVANA